MLPVLRPDLKKKKDSDTGLYSVCYVLSFCDVGSREGGADGGDHHFSRGVGEAPVASASDCVSWSLTEQKLLVPSRKHPEPFMNMPRAKVCNERRPSVS